MNCSINYLCSILICQWKPPRMHWFITMTANLLFQATQISRNSFALIWMAHHFGQRNSQWWILSVFERDSRIIIAIPKTCDAMHHGALCDSLVVHPNQKYGYSRTRFTIFKHRKPNSDWDVITYECWMGSSIYHIYIAFMHARAVRYFAWWIQKSHFRCGCCCRLPQFADFGWMSSAAAYRVAPFMP